MFFNSGKDEHHTGMEASEGSRCTLLGEDSPSTPGSPRVVTLYCCVL